MQTNNCYLNLLMAEALQTGLLLFVVGMITVFTVLSFVVLTGKVLIAIVNHTDRLPKAKVTSYHPNHRTISAENDKRKIAVVIAAAFIMTKGKGRIKGIQRIDDE